MSLYVVYKSISGFTKRYAQWLAEELKAECYELTAFRNIGVQENDTVLYGGSMHAVGINGFQEIKKQLAKKRIKQLIVFAVGASPKIQGLEDEIIEANFTAQDKQNIRLFYLRGGFDYSKLDFKNKVLMKLLQIKLRMKKVRTSDEQGMLAAYTKPLDVAKKENIYEIVEYTKTIL